MYFQVNNLLQTLKLVTELIIIQQNDWMYKDHLTCKVLTQ